MKKIFKSERELLQGIIDKDGDCISVNWCAQCPFSVSCVTAAVLNAKLLSKEARVSRAIDRLFDELIEDELSDEQIEPNKKTT